MNSIKKHRGLFITFEGPDGCGKTTIIKKLVKELTKKFDVVVTREPGGSNNILAEKIRSILLDDTELKINNRSEALLFAASRAQHVADFIKPNLEANKIVISDRYIDSSLIYQGYARKLGMDDVFEINKFAIDNILPDLTILLMVDAKVGLERIQRNRQSEMNRLDKESLKWHNLVHEGYLKLAKIYPKRIVMINAEQSIELVYQDVYQIVINKIKSNYVK